MEILHNALLIHHDAAERVRSRRAHETVWVRYGLDQAVCCGDGMYFWAMECISKMERPTSVTKHLSSLIRNHMLEVIRAQVKIHQIDETISDPMQWIELSQKRIGGVFANAIVGAAVLAECDDRTLAILEMVGMHFGVIFQVQADLVDLLGTPLGGKRGASIVDGKMTLLAAHCLTNSSVKDQESLREIIRKQPKKTTPEDVAFALRLMQQSGSFQYALQLVDENQSSIIDAADPLQEAKLLRLFAGVSEILFAPLKARISSGAGF